MGDLFGLVEKIHEVVPMDQQAEILQKVSEGNFTFRIICEWFQSILKMGPLNQLISMLPGFSVDLMSGGSEKERQAKIKGFMTMMDSITTEELDSSNLKLINGSRIMRIARGSGHQVRGVMEMIEEYKALAKKWSMMKVLLKIPKKCDRSALFRNFNAPHGSQVLPPDILKQDCWHGWFENLDGDWRPLIVLVKCLY